MNPPEFVVKINFHDVTQNINENVENIKSYCKDFLEIKAKLYESVKFEDPDDYKNHFIEKQMMNDFLNKLIFPIIKNKLNIDLKCISLLSKPYYDDSEYIKIKIQTWESRDLPGLKSYFELKFEHDSKSRCEYDYRKKMIYGNIGSYYCEINEEQLQQTYNNYFNVI